MTLLTCAVDFFFFSATAFFVSGFATFTSSFFGFSLSSFSFSCTSQGGGHHNMTILDAYIASTFLVATITTTLEFPLKLKLYAAVLMKEIFLMNAKKLIVMRNSWKSWNPHAADAPSRSESQRFKLSVWLSQ